MIVIISIEGDDSNTERNMYEDLADNINKYSIDKVFDIHFYAIGHRNKSDGGHIKGWLEKIDSYFTPFTSECVFFIIHDWDKPDAYASINSTFIKIREYLHNIAHVPNENIIRIYPDNPTIKTNNFENDVFFKVYNPPLEEMNYKEFCKIKKLQHKPLKSIKKKDFGPLFQFVSLAHDIEFYNFDNIIQAISIMCINLKNNKSSHFPILELILKTIKE